MCFWAMCTGESFPGPCHLQCAGGGGCGGKSFSGGGGGGHQWPLPALLCPAPLETSEFELHQLAARCCLSTVGQRDHACPASQDCHQRDQACPASQDRPQRDHACPASQVRRFAKDVALAGSAICVFSPPPSPLSSRDESALCHGNANELELASPVGPSDPDHSDHFRASGVDHAMGSIVTAPPWQLKQSPRYN